MLSEVDLNPNENTRLKKWVIILIKFSLVHSSEFLLSCINGPHTNSDTIPSKLNLECVVCL